jgi:hypothetical protein
MALIYNSQNDMAESDFFISTLLVPHKQKTQQH